MGQKGKSLKRFNDNQTLFENKTAEADLGCSFQTRTPENLVNDFDKLDLVHQTPFVQPKIKTQNDSGIETPSDTLNNFKNLNIRPVLSLSTKRLLYKENKENLLKQVKENTPEIKKLSQHNSNITPYSSTLKENVKVITNNSSVPVKDDTFYVSPETSRYNYDTSLYHSIREITVVPDSPNSSLCNKNSNSQVDSSLSTKKVGCVPFDDQLKYSLELSPAAKYSNSVINTRSPICRIPVDFIQDGEFKRPINSVSNVCVKCANENCITVKGINYSILNTLGHGGSSVVYEVNILVFLYYF